MSQDTQQFTFETDVQKVLNILIHSLYTHKEIFLRELISNASDAIDKVNYYLMTDEKEKVEDHDIELKIDIITDKDKNILKICDSGIGMTEEEMKKNLGKIAHSGSLEFLEKINSKQKDVDLIGQFGVGFYSVFMVAEEVRVHSKSYQSGSEGKVWISDGKSGYRIEKSDLQTQRGTTIEVVLKEDEKEFLEKFTLENIIHKYSNFVNFPIFIDKEQTNKISALWTKNKNEITKDQYKDFYQFISKQADEPIDYIHTKIDSPIQYSSILFIPASNMEKLGFMKYEQGIQLYCKKVLIQGDNKNLLPPYLRFVYGVVDSEDLNLNVSREMIQNDPILQKIKSNLTKKILDDFIYMAKNEKDQYQKVWEEFGKFIKEAVHMDFSHREQITSLLRFHSSHPQEINEWISLEEYKNRMQTDQKEIYYLTGPDLKSISQSPYLEIFKKEGIEVLYLNDPMDEFVLSNLMQYEEKKFKSIEQADLEFLKDKKATPETDENPEEKKAQEEKVEKLINFIKLTLKEDVADVIESKRLVDSPSCLVNAEDAPSSHVQKLLKMMNKDALKTKKIMEINPDNMIIKNLSLIYEKDPSSETLKEIIYQLYENALIVLDGISEHPEQMIKRIEKIFSKVTELMIK